MVTHELGQHLRHRHQLGILDPDTKTMIAKWSPKQLLAESHDPKVIPFPSPEVNGKPDRKMQQKTRKRGPGRLPIQSTWARLVGHVYVVQKTCEPPETTRQSRTTDITGPATARPESPFLTSPGPAVTFGSGFGVSALL